MSEPIDWNCKQINNGNASVFVVGPYNDAAGSFVGYFIASGTVQRTIVVDKNIAMQNPEFKEGNEVPLVLIAPRLTGDGSFHGLLPHMVYPSYEAASKAWRAASGEATEQISGNRPPGAAAPGNPLANYHS